ncbi:unnamed protein product [Ixodes pacificus]
MDDDERAPLLQTPVNQAASESLRSNRSACSSTSEALSSQSVRSPFHYPVGEQGRVLSDPDLNAAATYSRYRYYNKLVHPATQLLAIPDHVVPAYFLVPFFNTEAGGEQSSLVTIFAIWNTMMGTSLLSMPWAISQAGFATGTLLILVIGGLCLYTAFRVLDSTRLAGPPGGGPVEFSDVCRHLLGPWGERLAMAFSLLPLLGACVVFWVLMATFLSGTALFLHGGWVGGAPVAGLLCGEVQWQGEDLICRHASNGTLGVELSPSSVLESKYTMPLALVVLLFPVINLKSPSFFYKFNALGTVSVFYLLIYILINAFTWGINVDFVDETSTSYVPLFRTTFPALTGVLCLSFFIHNCVISMMRNQKNPEHNARDLSVAFGLVITTYLLIAVPFYISFPLAKHCIEDNLLNNFSNHNVMAFVTRIFLLVQYTTLFPMITYLLRVQFMHWVYRLVYPGLKQVMALNAVVVVMCVLFAIFLPQIGTILRFCGALSGLVYIFTLPCIIYMVAMRGKLTACSMVFHSFIILLGLANFASQFLLQYLESLA